MNRVPVTPQPPTTRMAVLIDADNLNDPTALDHVLQSLRSTSDKVPYRRAYGRPDSLKGIESVLWKHGVRPVANLVVDKVTTDSALVIDAVEAVCTGQINAVALCSGDADFVPLALWLREKGCRVICYSLSNKIFANPESFYDDVVLLDGLMSSRSVPAPSPKPKASPVIPAPEPPQAVPVKEAVPSATVTVPAAAPKPSVKAILAALPELRTHEPQHLSQVAKKLREAGLLGKSASSTVLFRTYESQFELLPKAQPNQVRYRG